MKIRCNEKVISLKKSVSLGALREMKKPLADVVIYNGAPVPAECFAKIRVSDGDSVVFIRKGEKPSRSEMRALLVARNSPEVSAKISGISVGIAGAGGLGSAIAMALARTGIGKIIIADFDIVEPSNLNRQMYSVSQLGIPKVFALKANILAANPYVKVDAKSIRLDDTNVSRVFRGADIIVEAFDAPEAKAMLARAAKKAWPARPLILASGLAGCEPADWIKTVRLGPALYCVGDMETGAEPGRGLMAPRVMVAAGHMANLVLRLALDPGTAIL